MRSAEATERQDMEDTDCCQRPMEIPITTMEPEEEERKPIPRYKTLLYNWLEERATAELDELPPTDKSRGAQAHRYGHPGLLTLDFTAQMSDRTTIRDAFRKPEVDKVPHRGKRDYMLQQYLYNMINKDAYVEDEPPPPPPETKSTMQCDYHAQYFKPVPVPPTKDHDYRMEQALTFWSENKHDVTGVSSIRTRDTPFKKSSTFSKPISEYLDEPMPYTQENYPNL